MSRRRHDRWTDEALALCRQMYENGDRTADIGARFGISATTVSVMAWQRRWRRTTQARRSPATARAALFEAPFPSGDLAGDAVEAEQACRQEQAFNDRLRAAIAEYWRARGKRIDLATVAQDGGVLGIRSRSTNGVPVLSSPPLSLPGKADGRGAAAQPGRRFPND